MNGFLEETFAAMIFSEEVIKIARLLLSQQIDALTAEIYFMFAYFYSDDVMTFYPGKITNAEIVQFKLTLQLKYRYSLHGNCKI